MNRRGFFASLCSTAALPAVGDDPEVLAALRHAEWMRLKTAEMDAFADMWGRALSIQMWGEL